MKPTCITLDFETEAIAPRPAYPPKPVGFSIQNPGERKSTYWAWGHPSENNCTRSKAQEILRGAWRSEYPILCQHGKFDIDVAQTHMGVGALPWERTHDTEYLLFLSDPHARSLSLKPAAERILGMKPEERDAVRDWLIAAGIVKRNQADWGAYISKAPGKLVGTYANGDVKRTIRLFNHLYPEIVERNMLAAYQRELKLMPILLETERQGIRVNLSLLRRDYKLYTNAQERADSWLRKKLRAPDLNFDADKDVGEALDRAGVVTDWTWTKGGKGRAPQRSVSKANLTIDRFRSQQVAMVFAYRNRLATCLSMFMRPWLVMAEASGGVIYTNWNQVRQAHGNDLKGTRTGRLSSNPNFQNISTDFEGKDDGYQHLPFMTALGLPPLPLMRKYLLPDEGEVWIHRDINQQELRLLAHFEDGELMAHYCRDPRFDIHTTVQQGIFELAAIELARRSVKIVNFSDVYGKGLMNLAASLGVDRKTAQAIRDAKNALMPGVDALTRDIKARGARGEAIRTWGGREYFAEKTAFSKKYGRMMDFYYKLLNYLIQGSSADFTKEAIIRYHSHPQRKARFLLSVHDELNASSPANRVKQEMEILREAIEEVPGIDVPMLADGKTGRNWGSLKKWKEA